MTKDERKKLIEDMADVFELTGPISRTLVADALAIAEAAIRKDCAEITREFDPAGCAELSFQSAQDQIADAILASTPERP